MSNISPIRISIIVAMNKGNRAIGANNALLWKIPADLKRFKELTTGHSIIMGRKTYESIGRPLPNRTNIIVTRDSETPAMIAAKTAGCLVCPSLSEAIEIAKRHDDTEIFVIGGGEIYKQALPVTDRLYLTLVDSDSKGDVFFPEYEKEFTSIIEQSKVADHNPPYEWLTLER